MSNLKTATAKRVAIVQSNYIPWKGYFDLIAQVDEFVLYDDMQYTRRDWRNRNKIKTANGLSWLTIAVQVKGKYTQAINQTLISDPNWAKSHWDKIRQSYIHTPYFKALAPMVQSWFEAAADKTYLSDVNQFFIRKICDWLQITTVITDSRDYSLVDGQSERLLGVCLDLKASHYLSGPAAKDYLDETVFDDQGIAVDWMDYGQYQHYPQAFGEFAHGVSILDVMFNCGPDTRAMIASQQAWSEHV